MKEGTNHQFIVLMKKCCGIIGIITKNQNATKICLEGIELLQNRGYDSAGIATVNENKELSVTKFASDSVKGDCIQRLKAVVPNAHKESKIGIGHTRWATHGGKTDENAHPHSDEVNFFKKTHRFALIHNGILDNYRELRKELLEKGIKLSSETDTELIVQTISHLVRSEGLSTVEAAKKTFEEKIRGTWGVILMDREDPEKLIVSRNGSPMLIGIDHDSIFVASERIAFEKYTSNYIALKDGEIFVVDINLSNDYLSNLQSRVLEIKEKTKVELEPQKPFSYFYEQEIHEQPEAILRAFSMGARLASNEGEDTTKLGGLEQHAQELKNVENLVIVASGTSLHAGMFASEIFHNLKCFNTIQCIEASEFCQHHLPKIQPGAIFISQSGETADVYKALKIAKSRGMLTMGIVNVVGSLISSTVDCGVYVNSGREVAVAATKSFTCQTVVLILIAIWISCHKGETNLASNRIKLKDSLRQLPALFGQTIYQVKESVSKLALILKDTRMMMILAKGPAFFIAKSVFLIQRGSIES